MSHKHKFEVGERVLSVAVGSVPAFAGAVGSIVRGDYYNVVRDGDGTVWLRSDNELTREKKVDLG